MMSGLSAVASTLTVTSLADDGTVGTLRSQIAAAASGDTIDFSVTGTIQLVGSSEIGINKNLTIAGPGEGSLTVNGPFSYAVGIFDISDGIVSISGLKLTNGKGKSVWAINENTGTYGWKNSGGAIYMSGGTVTLMSSTLSANFANEGGAIYMNGGSLVVTGSTISNNNIGSSGWGGGIYVRDGSLVVERSTISGNTAGWGAGILIRFGTANIANSTISGNTAKHYWEPDPSHPELSFSRNGRGGGIFNWTGAVTVTNCTISGNVAEGTNKILGCVCAGCTCETSNSDFLGGGGILNGNAMTVVNSTITDNSAVIGAGIRVEYGTLQLFNSILATNGSGGDLKGSTSGNYNLVQNGDTIAGTNNITGQPAFLGPLANNGGPTLTHALLSDSPALDAGDPNFDATNTPYDQRGAGFPRVKNGRLCMGAFESERNQSGSSFIVTTLDDHDDGTGGPIDCSLREAIKYAPTGATITFAVTGTITLTLGELVVDKSLTITGPAQAPGITVSGNHASRIFRVTHLPSVTITANFSNLTLIAGNGVSSVANTGGGAIWIDNQTPLPTVTVTSCTFSDNHVAGGAGAIRNAGTLTVTGCTFSGNSSAQSGGAFQGGGTLTVKNSTLSGNSANGSGSTGIGGAISMLSGTLTVTGCTLSGNSASIRGGGLATGTSTVNLTNTIIAGNTAPTGPDISGTVDAGDYNLVQDTAGATLSGTHNITGQGALLAPLANNGGPTKTHALLAGSPAIDKGDTTLTEDQRGVSRPQRTADDIGAFELEPHRPTLAIQVIPPSQVEICWDTVTNTWYQLQYRSPLGTNQWSPLTAWISGNDQTFCTNDSVLVSEPQRFYQVGVTNTP